MLDNQLSSREIDVLRLISDGLSAKQVAQTLSIAPRTVEHHIDHARMKTRTRNRVHLIAHVVNRGLLIHRHADHQLDSTV